MKESTKKAILKSATYCDMEELGDLMLAMVKQNIAETAAYFYEDWGITENVVGDFKVVYYPKSSRANIFYADDMRDIQDECFGEEPCELAELMELAKEFEGKYEYRSYVSEY